MKKLFVVMALLATTMLGACTTVKPPPGQEAVLIDQPVFIGSGGVRPETIKTGLSYTWFSTTPYYVDVTPQTIGVSLDDYSTSDNIFLDFETKLQYQVTNPADLIAKFGPDWFKNNIEQQYTSIVRDQVKRYDMSKLMSDPVTAAAIDDEVTKQISQLVKDRGIAVRIINVTLGRARPNADVLTQMNLTAAQQQRSKTLAEATNAEKQRQLEQEAKADADNAYRLRMNLTPEQYLASQIAQINADACANAQACYVVPAGSVITR